MFKHYKVIKENVIDLLDDLDYFEEKMEVFNKKYNGYSYEIKINKEGNTWEGDVKITKNEKTKTT